jgi:hypothetical protein
MEVATLAPSLEPTSELKMYCLEMMLLFALEPLSNVTVLQRSPSEVTLRTVYLFLG